MAKKKMLSKIKQQIKQSKKSFGTFLRVQQDKKVKIRVINKGGYNDAFEIVEHDKYGKISPTPCLAYHFGKECKYCKDPDIRRRMMYAITVYDYSTKERKIFKAAANTFSPIPQLAEFQQTYGNLTDRDYVISRKGIGTSTSYTVVPLDKKKFKKNLKPFTDEEILKKLVASTDEYEWEDVDDFDEADIDEEAYDGINWGEVNEDSIEDDDEVEEDEEDEEETEEADDDEYEVDDDIDIDLEDLEDDDEDEEDEEEEKPKKTKKKNKKKTKKK